MAIELQMLVWSIVLGLVHLAVGASLNTQQRGLAWNAGPRDGVAKPLSGVAARVDRALGNFLETFPFFVAAVLVVMLTQRNNAGTVLGAQLYFWARLAYVPIYAAGIPYLRSAVWAVSLAGLIKLLLPLF